MFNQIPTKRNKAIGQLTTTPVYSYRFTSRLRCDLRYSSVELQKCQAILQMYSLAQARCGVTYGELTTPKAAALHGVASWEMRWTT